MSAVAASIRGYCTEIGVLQPRQRPRSSSQENTGMFSYHGSERAQLGQRERGWTTDCFGSAPQRRMQTLRKLPMMAPKMAAKVTTIVDGSGTSAATHDLVQENAGGD